MGDTPRSLHERCVERLSEVRSGAGFGPVPGAPAEPEPTAVAAIGLDDEAAREWLTDNQREDGGFGLVAGPVISDAATSIAALALPPGEARERALGYLVTHRAERRASYDLAPHDPETRGWGWTRGTFGWVEPTARAVLALRLHRPGSAAEIDDGLAVIADRECAGGGWNYGNSIVYDVPVPPYAQTTAIALIGIQGAMAAQTARGLTVLRDLWANELGGLSLAMTLAAFRLAGDPDATRVETALERELGATGLLDDVVAIAWSAIASGPGLETLRWRAA